MKTIDRRGFMRVMLAAGASVSWGLAGGKFPVLRQAHAMESVASGQAVSLSDLNLNKLIQGALDDSLWIPDGPPSDKQLYVFAAPWCGAAQAFYLATRKHSSTVQFRWIMCLRKKNAPVDVDRQLTMLGRTRDPAKLKGVYMSAGSPMQGDMSPSEVLLNYMESVTVGAFHCLSRLPTERQNGLDVRSPSTPTLVWFDGNNWLCGGARTGAELDQILKSISPRPGSNQWSSIGPQLCGGADKFEIVKPSILYAYGMSNETPTDRVLVASSYPDQRAPVGGVIGAGNIRIIAGAVKNTDWLALNMGGMGRVETMSFIKDPIGARVLTAGLNLQPVRGRMAWTSRETTAYFLPGTAPCKVSPPRSGWPTKGLVTVDDTTWVVVTAGTAPGGQDWHAFLRSSDVEIR